MPTTPNPFPLNILDKVDSPELAAFFSQFGPDKYIGAENFNKVLQALQFLYENLGGDFTIPGLTDVLAVSDRQTKEINPTTYTLVLGDHTKSLVLLGDVNTTITLPPNVFPLDAEIQLTNLLDATISWITTGSSLNFLPSVLPLGATLILKQVSLNYWVANYRDSTTLTQADLTSAINQLINGAPSDGDTLKELNDKIIALQAIVGGTTTDGDSIVNTVTELLAVFSTYPEATNILDLLNAKFDSANVYNALDCIVSGKALDARAGKALKDLIDSLTTTVGSINVQWTAGSNNIWNNNSGNVGIGTNAPTSGRLVIKGSGNTIATYSVVLVNSAGTIVGKVDDLGSLFLDGNLTTKFIYGKYYSLNKTDSASGVGDGGGTAIFRVKADGLFSSNAIIEYLSDLSANYTARSLVDRGYVDTTRQEEVFRLAKNGTAYFNDFTGVIQNMNDGTLQTGTSGTGSNTIFLGTVPLPSLSRQGFAQLQTGTTSSGIAALYIGTSNAGSFYLGGGIFIYEVDVCTETLSTSSERFFSLFGFNTANTLTPNNAIAFIYDEGAVFTGNSASANWKTVTINGLTRTFTDTGVAVSISAWQKLRFEVNAAASEVKFYINGTLVATHTTNIPSGTSKPMMIRNAIIKQVGTTTRNQYLDYVAYKQTFTTAR